jgi:glycosyltransferase involved in cell wall biosynthesis
MPNYPKITVITPSFNQGEFLEDTITSILSQNYPNLEYMIIDGGSTDNSVEIINQYAAQLTYFVSEKDNGQSDAINKGLQRATGEYITWINSDDQLLPNALQTVAQCFQENPAAWVVHGRTILFGEEMEEQEKGCPSGDLAPHYLASLPFPQPSSFFSKAALDEVGLLNADYHYGMDYDFFVKIALNHDFLATEHLLSKYLMHTNSKSVSQTYRFADDYGRVFSRVLRSFSFSQPLIEKLIDFGLYDKGKDTYTVSKTFDYQTLQQATLLNLRYRLAFYYEDMQLEKVKTILECMKAIDATFVANDAELSQIDLKTKFVPKLILQQLRKFKRCGLF